MTITAPAPHDNLIVLQNTYVTEPCQRCQQRSDIWQPKYGVSLVRLCLKCWGVALGILDEEAAES